MRPQRRRRIRLPSGRYVDAPPRRSRPQGPSADGARLEAHPHAPTALWPQDEHSRAIGRASPGTMVTLLGAGSVGGYAGLNLARLGYDIAVVDQDVLKPSNIEAGRSPYPRKMLGMSKAHAFAAMVREAELGVLVHPFFRSLESFSDAELQALCLGSAAVMASLDDRVQQFRLNRLTYPDCQVVYPAFHAGARTAHVLFTAPGTACFQCALGVRSPGQLTTLHGEPAMPLDIQQLSQLAARVVLALTSPGVPELDGLLDPTRNILFINNRPFGPRGGELVSSQLDAEPDPRCPVCSPFADRERG